ncbi:transcriptional regulator, partial [Acinetobacter baumannii]
MKDGLQIEEMKNAADSVVGTLKSLANTDRLLILCHLAHEELN